LSQHLRENIRYLGKILGETILAQDGKDKFDLIENIRKTAVRIHRNHDREAVGQLENILRNLSSAETICVVRAFSYFKHLVNIAEDLHAHQVTRLNDDNPVPGTLAYSMKQIEAEGLALNTIDEVFQDALVSPVLTAHPTEVQRKTILDTERNLADLLSTRAGLISGQELDRNHLLIQGAITLLWQTRILRFSKLTVANEIENSLSYYEATFLETIPEILQDLERDINQ